MERMKNTRFISFVAAFSMAALLLMTFACKQDGYKRTESGLRYKLFPMGKGNKPKLGDYLLIDMLIKSVNDSVLLDTRKQRKAIATLMLTPSFKGGMEEAFGMMAAGDSGVFAVSADSVFQKTFQKPLPEYIPKGSDLTFYLTMRSITPKVEYDEEQSLKEQEYMKKLAERKEKEPELLLNYIKDNHIAAKPTPSGLYFINKETGKGAKPAKGKLVKVRYVAKYLDGTVVDQSDSNKEPMAFNLLQHEVIAGMDEGISMMREGGKATLIVPSGLGYGDVGREKSVLPYSSLIFDVELVEVGK